MRCHYEVLAVDRDADDTMIKKSYRKLALQYHPDKNPDNVAECTAVFNEVQAAYDVLSDMQERAWYDKHRDQILMGAGTDYVDDGIELMHYFNTSVFKGFGDDENGFYAVYREAFERIASEDEKFMDDDEDREFPTFGDSQSSFEDVVKVFYSFWLGYFTKKPYTWADKYDLRQAPNRPTQRLMEKENKKFRDVEKKKRNEEVRALVSFIRKRDKRVVKYREQLELKQRENQLKFEKKRAADKLVRQQEMETYEEQEWMSFDNMQGQLESIETLLDVEFGCHSGDNFGISDEEDLYEKLYCIACDKAFKSEKALSNHEKSKKHKENIELIRAEMGEDLLQDLRDNLKIEKEATEMVEEEEESSDESPSDPDAKTNSGEYNRIGSLNLKNTVIKQSVIDKIHDETREHTLERSPLTEDDVVFYISDPEESNPKVKERKKKSKKKPISEDSDDDSSEIGSLARNSLEIVKPVSKKKAREARRKKKLSDIHEKNSMEDDEYRNVEEDEEVFKSEQPNEEICERLSGTGLDTVYAAASSKTSNSIADDVATTNYANETPETLVEDNPAITCLKESEEGDKQTDESKPANGNSCPKILNDDYCGQESLLKTKEKQKNKKKGKQIQNQMSVDIELHLCGVCGNDYPTRNKLFDHIKAERHTVPKDVNGKKDKTKKGKNK